MLHSVVRLDAVVRRLQCSEGGKQENVRFSDVKASLNRTI